MLTFCRGDINRLLYSIGCIWGNINRLFHFNYCVRENIDYLINVIHCFVEAFLIRNFGGFAESVLASVEVSFVQFSG